MNRVNPILLIWQCIGVVIGLFFMMIGTVLLTFFSILNARSWVRALDNVMTDITSFIDSAFLLDKYPD